MSSSSVHRIAGTSRPDQDVHLGQLGDGLDERDAGSAAAVGQPRAQLHPCGAGGRRDPRIAGLDPAQRMEFRQLLRDLGDTCVVVSTHLVEDVAAACTDVVLLDAGKVVFQGTTAELQAAGTDADPGDSPLERGYSALLTREATR